MARRSVFSSTATCSAATTFSGCYYCGPLPTYTAPLRFRGRPNTEWRHSVLALVHPRTPYRARPVRTAPRRLEPCTLTFSHYQQHVPTAHGNAPPTYSSYRAPDNRRHVPSPLLRRFVMGVVGADRGRGPAATAARPRHRDVGAVREPDVLGWRSVRSTAERHGKRPDQPQRSESCTGPGRRAVRDNILGRCAAPQLGTGQRRDRKPAHRRRMHRIQV